MGAILSRYGEDWLWQAFEDEGIPASLAERGFSDLRLRVETEGLALPHVRLYGARGGGPVLLLDACLGEASVRAPFFAQRGQELGRTAEFAVVHWVREQDPTTGFSLDRPRLPLQDHPGLGLLRRAFRIVVRMALDLGKDGVLSVPKFFHDAVIFWRSRLFLFLDPEEQGRFVALMRDLRPLPLGEASLALLDGRVRDDQGQPTTWNPGYLACPLSPDLIEYFHCDPYASAVEAASQVRFEV